MLSKQRRKRATPVPTLGEDTAPLEAGVKHTKEEIKGEKKKKKERKLAKTARSQIQECRGQRDRRRL